MKIQMVLTLAISPLLTVGMLSQTARGATRADTGVECAELQQAKTNLNGTFKMKVRDFFLVSECGADLTDGNGKPVSKTDLRDAIKDCREKLTDEVNDMVDSPAKLNAYLKELNKKLGNKIDLKGANGVSLTKHQIVQAIVGAMLSDQIADINLKDASTISMGSTTNEFKAANSFAQAYLLTEYTEQKLKEEFKNLSASEVEEYLIRWTSPSGEQKIFMAPQKQMKERALRDIPMLEKINPDITRLAFSPYNINIRKNFSSPPSEVTEIINPHLDFPKVQSVINLDNSSIVVIHFNVDKQGQEFIAGQDTYPLGNVHIDLPNKSYLNGRLTWQAKYDFNCRPSAAAATTAPVAAVR